MKDNKIKIKEGITLHVIDTNKFKTNMMAIFLTKKLTREGVTKEALIPAVLRLGTNNIKTQKEINKKLEELYGANFNCGIEKRGDNHILKFYMESICDEYSLENEDVLNKSISLLIDLVFNPLQENERFSDKYVEGEKENLRRIIEARIDNKANYAFTRCIEEMYKNQEYGLYEYGYVEDLENINSTNLYEYYKKIIDESKIDIFVSGKIEDAKKIENIITNNKEINKLKDRKPEYIQDSKLELNRNEIKEIKDKMDVAQGKIVIGINIKNNVPEEYINVYNTILGGGSNSKLFQNVREKASLAYTAGSRYLKTKNDILIRCGIEISNYDKAIKIIKEQLEDLKNGNFTEEDIQNAKELFIASISKIEDEQASEISYTLAQEISGDTKDINEIIENINRVNKENVMEVANNLRIDTIYFLTNN
jgi:predicted Zn-dependent peptidase